MLKVSMPSIFGIRLDFDQAATSILELTNLERARFSLCAVQRHPRLDAVAAYHCSGMSTRGYFDHVDPERRGPQDRVRLLFPEMIGGIGENLACVPFEPQQLLARSVVKGWMNSPGHRENLLTASHTHMGIHLLLFKGQVFATQMFAGLVTEILERGLPVHVGIGEKRLLHFKFHGSYPRNDLMVVIEVPDRQAWVYGGNGSFRRGIEMLKPQWDSNTDFNLIFSARYGRGRYKLSVGRTSTGLYSQDGIDIDVQ